MKARNNIIIGLALIGIIFFGVVQGIIIPQKNQKEQQYIINQQEPTTHDFDSVLKYKHEYMGNAGNLMNLFYSLPLNNLERTYQLYPDTLTAEINFKDKLTNNVENKGYKALIYNASAAFSLIDNLEIIYFNFEDVSYKVTKKDIEKWYGRDAATLAEKDIWKQNVQSKLNDEQYVLKCIHSVFQKD